MSKLLLTPHPGYLPTKPEPKIGDRLVIEVDGLPPYKDCNFSIRNPRHKIHDRFLKLRRIATTEMDGRKWSDAAILMTVLIFAPQMEKGRDLCAYVGGLMDTLDGSHGYYFTYLPIVYQDDSQVARVHSRFIESPNTKYRVEIEFVRAVEVHGITCVSGSSSTS